MMSNPTNIGTIETIRMLSGGSSTADASTMVVRESLEIPVDFEVTGAIEVPAGASFTTQAEVDSILDGAPAFKYLNQVLAVFTAGSSTPGYIVNINTAAGTHRPKSGELPLVSLGVTAAWYLGSDAEISLGGQININASTSKTAIVPAALVTAYTALDIVASTAPAVTFAGTPFSGLDLGGFMLETADGAFAVIDSNTDSTVTLRGGLSVAPTLGVTIAAPYTPSTAMRNSVTDPTAAATIGMYLAPTCLDTASYVSVRDCRVDSCGSTPWVIGVIGATPRQTNVYARRCLTDFDAEIADGFTPNARHINAYHTDGYLLLEDHSMRAPDNGGLSLANKRCDGIEVSGGGLVLLRRCMFRGMEDPLQATNGSRIRAYSTAFVDIGRTAHATRVAMSISDGASVLFSAYTFAGYDGQPNVFRDSDGDALVVEDGGIVLDDGAFSCVFENTVRNAVVVRGSKCTVDTGTSGGGAHFGGFRDGGGNTGLGLLVEGRRHDLEVVADSDITGTSGDTDVEGTVRTWAVLTGVTPLVTTLLTIVE